MYTEWQMADPVSCQKARQLSPSTSELQNVTLFSMNVNLITAIPHDDAHLYSSTFL